ncbi:ATPase involved in DNA repair [Desulfosporosinus orientis DSM 765]|uniref:Nuclease SbcCD subunit C n=1 Tax=Desulfosporosinus orientis (strain ATCC 19365 / DSM 765 / NCIMB 8382 / VKM B-1628 / Singapore I) TaxID=768706 RepID=G7W7I5_DESOD|nr:AAA family ATPase [Desulfosporosinus orientis]AET65904.1 ATPase involved in DNA repair [Desulfosporosinus orientis DSM 765]
MRPILLKIAGLNSFREVQEIEFLKLCETGVFGIFGSTGSGKSTILDAITLALYGTVERAYNNTQGILNHAEDQLFVDFRFSLAAGEQRVTYRAERSYRRSGDRTVKASTCRLVEIVDGAETVLASKADEMTKKIEIILGLNVQDFTRAVVLPQGKFAEFLTIKPKDRRSMLERLFSLEAYGRELSARLSEQLEEVKFTLNGVEQRQQGLGDASAERVEEAKADLQRVSQKSETIEKELLNLKTQYEEVKEVWGFQEQLRQLKDEETQLAAEQPHIDKIAEGLSLAERAEALRSLLEEILVAEKQLKEAQEQIRAAEKRLREAMLAKETAESQWLDVNRKRLDEEPRFLRRLEQLEQAKSLEGDIQTRQERLNQARSDYSALDKTRKDYEKTLLGVSNQKTNLQKKMLEVKSKIANISVDPSLRKRVNAAVQGLEGYEMVSKQVENLQADLSRNRGEMSARQMEFQTYQANVLAAQKTVGELKEALSKLSNPSLSEEMLGARFQELERRRHKVANIERADSEVKAELERLQAAALERKKAEAEVEIRETEQAKLVLEIKAATELVEQKKAEVKALEKENLAGLLAEKLGEGEPCPVCGSKGHPQLAQSLGHELLEQAGRDLEEALEKLQGLEGAHQKVITKLAVAKAQLLSKKELEEKQTVLCETKHGAALAYRKELAEADRKKDVQTLQLILAEEDARLAKDHQALNQWKEDHEGKKRRLEEAQEMLAEAEKKQYEISSLMASLEAVEKNVGHRLSSLMEEQVQRKAALDNARGDIAIEDIRSLQKQYSSWDETSSVLNQNLSGFEEEYGKTGEVEEKLLREKSNCDLELQNLKTVGIEAARDLGELQRKWEAYTEGKPAQQLIEQVKKELTQITAREESLKKAYELAKNTWMQAEQSQAVCLKTLELSQRGFKIARQKLDLGLQKSEFGNEEEAKRALCEASERREMEQVLANYRQKVLVNKEKQEDVTERLKGRYLRPEEWLAWPIRLKEGEKVYTETIEQKGAAQQRLEKLQAAHKEWTKLEDQRKNLSHRMNLLKNLQTVFKGNAFVEFVAQEQLINVSLDASERLKQLTNQRYALEVDAEGGFIMRDDANGGVRRPVNSLSGGETFLTSLALALALSTQIQLRGRSPLEFFFLDEGFGTLDANLLETVMNTLEKLHLQNLTIGIISHVPELKNRLSRRLVLTPAEAGGAGSRVKLEMA